MHMLCSVQEHTWVGAASPISVWCRAPRCISERSTVHQEAVFGVDGGLSVQAQDHMKQQQVYVGSVAVNHSIEGPIPDPVALPAGMQCS